MEKNKDLKLITGQRILLNEISACLNKTFLLNNHETICSVLCDNEVFIPNAEFLEIFVKQNLETTDDLPLGFIKFWEGFILLLQERKLIEALFLQLLKLVNNENEEIYRRRVASQWLRSIADALTIHKISQQMRLEQDQISDSKNKKLSLKRFCLEVRNKVEDVFPDLKSPWLHCTIDIPFSRINKNFVQQFILNPNEFTSTFMPSLLDLIMPKQCSTQQEHLLSLLNIQTVNNFVKDFSSENSTIYTVEDLKEVVEQQNNKKMEVSENKIDSVTNFSDQTIRNTDWEMVSGKSFFI